MNNFTEYNFETLIYIIRGHKVMLDKDLASLYQVDTRSLNQAIKRNIDRFPEDFAFQLSADEWNELKSFIKNPTADWGGRRKYPFVFMEQGVAMLSSVLKSKRAIKTNIEIMRAFVKLRSLTSLYKELKKEIEKVDQKSDENYKIVLTALMSLEARLEPTLPKNRKKIGLV